LSRQRNDRSRAPSVAFLVAHVRSRVKQLTGARSARLKLTPTQLWSLVALAEGGPLTLGGLAGRVFADAPTMSRVVETLAGRGLVACACDETDRRRTLVRLTPAGEALSVEALRVAADIRARVVAGMDEGEQAALRTLLERVIANLDQA
jgi:DNA-binding MarR family transcriptional regulator